jgi:hypothetical protein
MGFFLCATPEAAHLCSPSQTIADIFERYQASVAADDANIL